MERRVRVRVMVAAMMRGGVGRRRGGGDGELCGCILEVAVGYARGS